MEAVQVGTIAAISTPPGMGAIAVVRVSGPDATQVLSSVAPALSHGEPRRAWLAAVRHPDTGELLDRAVIVVHPGPGRATRERT